MKKFDMEQCPILGMIQNQSLAQTSWRWNLWTPPRPPASKQLQIISWFHTNDISVHSSDPKFTHLIFRSHPDNLVCGWDPLNPPKSGPSDPNCLDHLTHFQPCFETIGFIILVIISLIDPHRLVLQNLDSGSECKCCHNHWIWWNIT